VHFSLYFKGGGNVKIKLRKKKRKKEEEVGDKTLYLL
jgi:hypothetical protein